MAFTRAIRLLSATSFVSAAFGIVASAAQAADMAITWDPDPTEERGLRITATGTADPGSEVFVTVRPAGGSGCAVNYGAEDPGSSDVLSDFDTSGQFTLQDTHTFDEPGDYLLCGYIQEGFSDATPAATATATITVRSARATLALTLPPAVAPSRPFVIGAGGVAEFSRELFVTYRPAGGPACGATYEIEDQDSTDLISFDDVQGSFADPATLRDGLTRGSWLFCGYVQESSSDTAPEAVATATLTVGSVRAAPARCQSTATRRYRYTRIRATGVRCSTAIRRLTQGRPVRGGGFRLRGWQCARTGRVARGGTYRCVSGSRVLSFTARRR